MFHADSYGYRPGRSAIDAVRTARQRCWRYDWVLDIDVRSYFDSIDWEPLLKAVRRHTDCPWVLLYIERWLKAPVQMEDGSVVPRSAGTPQGGVISPILANLFLHYAFDMWMARSFRLTIAAGLLQWVSRSNQHMSDLSKAGPSARCVDRLKPSNAIPNLEACPGNGGRHLGPRGPLPLE